MTPKFMMKFSLLALLFVSFLMGCQPKEKNEHPLISAYSQAWNNKDIDAMAALMHPDIEWLSVSGNDVSVEVSGKTELSQVVQGYFESPNLPTGSLKGWSFNGNYVSVTETAHWTNDEGEPQSQSALTVYELKDGLIRRVYYYPSV